MLLQPQWAKVGKCVTVGGIWWRKSIVQHYNNFHIKMVAFYILSQKILPCQISAKSVNQLHKYFGLSFFFQNDGRLPSNIFRSSPQRWPNKPGKNVSPSVRTYVTSVRKFTIKLNAAANQIVVFVTVDESFTKISLSRSSEVKVKVTWDLKV